MSLSISYTSRLLSLLLVSRCLNNIMEDNLSTFTYQFWYSRLRKLYLFGFILSQCDEWPWELQHRRENSRESQAKVFLPPSPFGSISTSSLLSREGSVWLGNWRRAAERHCNFVPWGIQSRSVYLVCLQTSLWKWIYTYVLYVCVSIYLYMYISLYTYIYINRYIDIGI